MDLLSELIKENFTAIQPWRTYGSDCSYCRRPGNHSRDALGSTAHSLHAIDYEDLLEKNFLRSGTHVYQPSNETACCPNVPIRLEALHYAPTKDQTRVLKTLNQYLSGQKPITLREVEDDDEVLDRILALAEGGQLRKAAEVCVDYQASGRLIIDGVEYPAAKHPKVGGDGGAAAAPSAGDAASEDATSTSAAEADVDMKAGAALKAGSSARSAGNGHPSAGDAFAASLEPSAVSLQYIKAVIAPLVRQYLLSSSPDDAQATVCGRSVALPQPDVDSLMQRLTVAPAAIGGGGKKGSQSAPAGDAAYKAGSGIIGACNAAFLIAAAATSSSLASNPISTSCKPTGTQSPDDASQPRTAATTTAAPRLRGSSNVGDGTTRASIQAAVAGEIAARINALSNGSNSSGKGGSSGMGALPVRLHASAAGPGYINVQLVPSSSSAASLKNGSTELDPASIGAMRRYIAQHYAEPVTATKPSSTAAASTSRASASTGAVSVSTDAATGLPKVGGKVVTCLNAETEAEKEALAAHYRRIQEDREARGREILAADPLNPKPFYRDEEEEDEAEEEEEDEEEGDDTEEGDEETAPTSGTASSSATDQPAPSPKATRRAQREAAAAAAKEARKAQRAAEKRAHDIEDTMAALQLYLSSGIGGHLQELRARATRAREKQMQQQAAGASSASSSSAAASASCGGSTAAAIEVASKPPLLPFGPGPHKLTAALVRPRYSPESHELYARFNLSLHQGSPKGNTDSSYTRHLVDSPLRVLPPAQLGFMYRCASNELVGSPYVQVQSLDPFAAYNSSICGSSLPQPAVSSSASGASTAAGKSTQRAILAPPPTIMEDFTHFASEFSLPELAPTNATSQVLLSRAMSDGQVAWMLQVIRRALPHQTGKRRSSSVGEQPASSAPSYDDDGDAAAAYRRALAVIAGGAGTSGPRFEQAFADVIKLLDQAAAEVSSSSGANASSASASAPNEEEQDKRRWAQAFQDHSLTPIPPLPGCFLPLSLDFSSLLSTSSSDVRLAPCAVALALYAVALQLWGDAKRLEKEQKRAAMAMLEWRHRVAEAQRHLADFLDSTSDAAAAAAAAAAPEPSATSAAGSGAASGAGGSAESAENAFKRARLNSLGATSTTGAAGASAADATSDKGGGVLVDYEADADDDVMGFGASSASDIDSESNDAGAKQQHETPEQTFERLHAATQEPPPASWSLPPRWGTSDHVRELVTSFLHRNADRLEWIGYAVDSLLTGTRDLVEAYSPGGADWIAGYEANAPARSNDGGSSNKSAAAAAAASEPVDKAEALFRKYIKPVRTPSQAPGTATTTTAASLSSSNNSCNNSNSNSLAASATGSSNSSNSNALTAVGEADTRIEVSGWDLSLGFGSFFHEYRLDGVLIGVSVLDILPTRVASVYMFYLPSLRYLEIGKLSSLVEIWLTRQIHAFTKAHPEVLGLPHGLGPLCRHWDPNFYVHSCSAMSYKRHYHPSQIQDPAFPPGSGNWRNLTPEALLKFDVDPVASLSDILTSAVLPPLPHLEGGDDDDGDESAPPPPVPAYASASADAETIRSLVASLREEADADADERLDYTLQRLPDGSYHYFCGLSETSRALLEKGERQYVRAVGGFLASRIVIDPNAVAHVWARAQRWQQRKAEREEARRLARQQAKQQQQQQQQQQLKDAGAAEQPSESEA